MPAARSVPGSLLVLLLLAAASRPAVAQAGLDSLVPPSPAPSGFIHDGGPVLDAAARARLNGRIDSVQRATGGDVAVAILRDLRGRAPAEVGVAIYRAWGVGRVDSLGSARRDLGALLLIVPKELAPSGRGECWITTGLGAEAELRDADAGTICRRAVIPHLRERRYEAAVAAGVDGIGASFARTTAGLAPPGSADAAAADAESEDTGALAVGGVLLLAGLGAGGAGVGIVLLRRHRRRKPRPCPRGHGDMVRLAEADDDVALSTGQRAEERVRSIDYDVWACPTCDERLVLPYRNAWSSYQGCPDCGHRTVQRQSRTVRAATTSATGLEEITLACAHCRWRDVTTRTTPRVQVASGGGSGGSGGSSRGSSFGGSGRTSGGGGGGSY